MTTRTEYDSMGAIEVPAEHYWGAQTQRSINNFNIGRTLFLMPTPVIRALGVLKKSAALANQALGILPAPIASVISDVAQEVIDGKHTQEFPLVIFQTGSGTQSNMNANEVIASRANEILRGERGGKHPVHPNDHVNRGQSSNDTFPTAMYVAIVEEVRRILYPSLESLIASFDSIAARYPDIVMVGRTHLEDATPIRFDQVVSSWASQLRHALTGIRREELPLHRLAIGGTAVGTGLNTHPDFGRLTAENISKETGIEFWQADDLVAALASHDSVVAFSAALRTLAVALVKIANDIRWYASGPRAGMSEMIIPENEPGSSIMPGKVNPTQCEALTMVCAQVMGNDTTVAFAGSQGNFQLNVYKPVMVWNVLESLTLLAEGMDSFRTHCVEGLAPHKEIIEDHLRNSLMNVTALTPHIGYDAAASIAKLAEEKELPLKDAAVQSGYVTSQEFDEWVDFEEMTHPGE